jgi:hypothetical protein
MNARTELEILGDFVDQGYHLEEEADVTVTLWFKDQNLGAYSQFGIVAEDLRNACRRHMARLAGPPEILHCRNCAHWASTYRWQGNCSKHPWPRDKFSEDATANGCGDYEDKQVQYRVAARTSKPQG